MCPDGSVRGHLRTNAGGANLNREWSGGVYKDYDAPTLERSPEVYYVMRELERAGCDAYVDVHGDEELEARAQSRPTGGTARPLRTALLTPS